MPELPEVETIKNELLPHIVGRRFVEVILLWHRIVREPSAEEFCRRLTGQGIEDIRRRGKYLLFQLSSGETLILHLKMSGVLLLQPRSSNPDHHTSAIFHLDNGQGLYFLDQRRFGTMWLVKDADKVVGKLGVEPLESSFTPQVLSQLISRHRVPIKVLLCDQNLIAGIGNMYADEALFSAGIYPLKKANALSVEEVNRLHGAIGEVLWRGIGGKGASIDTYRRPGGERGSAHFKFQVAHRRGQLCYRCGTAIQRVPLRGRGTYFCPHCQPSEPRQGLL
jgi:formamidopyrimidine-DNA glycosylase